MTEIHVDATVLIGLGSIGRLDLLGSFDGDPIVLPSIETEVSTEPARTNLDRAMESPLLSARDPPDAVHVERAQSVLGTGDINGDVQLVAAVLSARDDNNAIAVISDDRRVRTVSRGFGAEVTGSIGVVVRAVAEGMSVAEGKEVVRELDSQGLHMTAELRERADVLIEQAATAADGQNG